jgi:outer membrane protein OmpA-like peptidoglycan-associated protein
MARLPRVLAAVALLLAATPAMGQPPAPTPPDQPAAFREWGPAPQQLQLLFDSGRSIPIAALREIIPEALALGLEPEMDRGILVIGHADRVGGRAYNQALSCRRARWLRDALISRGVSRHRILLFAYGEDRPLNDTADGVPDGANRRVETVLTPGWSQFAGSRRGHRSGC